MRTPGVQTIDLRALLNFERKAIAAALNLLEDRRSERQEHALAVLDDVAALPAPAHVVGITGPPGVGKSSLIARLIARSVQAQGRLGVVAVDPSSKISGGALLGDRSRMHIPSAAAVYARSFAARDRLGGLSREAFFAVFLLRHLCDMVLVETVGVGQSETDIANIADTVVLVVQPFSGDVLQFIKAGVMEIPDILAVNKADDAALADKAVAEVRAALAIEPGSDEPGWSNPVLAVSALSNLNLDRLDTAIAEHYRHVQAEGTLGSRRAEQEIAWAVGELSHELGRVGLTAVGGQDGVAARWARQPGRSAARKLANLLETVRSIPPHPPTGPNAPRTGR
jgi:LAO/AO transport system kinase